MHKQTTSPSKLLLCSVLICIIHSAQAATTENPWYDCSLRPYFGAVNNAGTINARDTYMPLKLGSDAEFGLGFTMVLNPDYDLEFSLSELNSAGTQLNYPGSGNENNALGVTLQNRKLSISGKKLWNRTERPFVPWLGLGIDGSQISTEESEHVAMAPGVITKPTLSRVSTAVGAHISAGVDIYPVKTSALALSIETRYNAAMLNGPLKGDLSSFALLIGIRWDFWPSTF